MHDEVDACDELQRHGIDGKRALVILDASCWWQQCQRDLIVATGPGGYRFHRDHRVPGTHPVGRRRFFALLAPS
jgi:hypothetical protein